MKKWIVPELRKRGAKGKWQVYSDGSYVEGKGLAYAAVFWTPSGKLSQRWMGRENRPASSVEAELRGVLLAVQMRNEAVPRIQLQEPWDLYLDCMSAVNMLQGKGLPSDKVLLDLVGKILAEAGPMRARWVSRRDNRDADQCAQRARALESSGVRAVLHHELPAAELDLREAQGQAARKERRRLHAEVRLRAKRRFSAAG